MYKYSSCALPIDIDNGITGTWSPATISTAAAGRVRIHLLHDVGLCATTTMDITIDPAIQSTFTQLGAYCVGRYPWGIIRDLIRGNNGLLVCQQL